MNFVLGAIASLTLQTISLLLTLVLNSRRWREDICDIELLSLLGGATHVAR